MPTFNFKIKTLNLPNEDFIVPININDNDREKMILEGAGLLSFACNSKTQINLSLTEAVLLLALIPNTFWGMNLRTKITKSLYETFGDHIDTKDILELNKDILENADFKFPSAKPSYVRDEDEEWVEPNFY